MGRRLLAAGVALGLATSLAACESSHSGAEQPPHPITQEHESPTLIPESPVLPLPHGVLDMSSAALHRAVAVEPAAVQRELSGTVQTIGSALLRGTTYNIYGGSGFVMEVGGVKYAVTAGHVVTPVNNPEPRCYQQYAYTHVNNQSRMYGITNRASTYSGNNKTGHFYGPDEGILRLGTGRRLQSQPIIPVQPTVKQLRPGTLLWNENWQPLETNHGERDRHTYAESIALHTPDQLVGMVLGKWQTEPDGQVVYGVITGIKAYGGGQNHIVEGASGSPWLAANGADFGVESGGFLHISAHFIERHFGIRVRNFHGKLRVELIQSVSEQSIRELIATMRDKNGCAQAS